MDDNSSLPPCLTEDCENSTAGFAMFPPAIDYAQAAITMVIIVVSMTVNLLIVYLVARFKRLRQRAFLLALLLIAFNLCYTVVVLPVVFVSAVLREWVFGYVGCWILGGINDSFFAANFMTILVLTLDRFFTIFMPFFYERHGNKIAIAMSLLPWLAGTLRFVVNASLECFGYAPTHKVCIPSGMSGTPCTVATSILTWGVVFIGVIIPIVLYVVMYLKGRQLNKQLVMSKEMEKKGLLNKRIFKTFLVLLIALGGVCFVAGILFFWFLLSPNITLAFYIIQTLIGRTLSNSVTVATPTIILFNPEVRNAWKNRAKSNTESRRQSKI